MNGGTMKYENIIDDSRLKMFWIQTSGTGKSIPQMTAKEYFNKITRNNQGNIK